MPPSKRSTMRKTSSTPMHDPRELPRPMNPMSDPREMPRPTKRGGKSRKSRKSRK